MPTPPVTRVSPNRRARLLGGGFVGMGILHLVAPGPFERTVPAEIPGARFWVLASGVAEVAGGVQLFRQPTRRVGWFMAALLVLVFPANVNMAVRPIEGLERVPRWALWARLPLQALAVWSVLAATRPEASDR